MGTAYGRTQRCVAIGGGDGGPLAVGEKRPFAAAGSWRNFASRGRWENRASTLHQRRHMCGHRARERVEVVAAFQHGDNAAAAISSASAKVRLDQIEVGERIAAVGIDRDRRAPLLPRSGAGVVGAPTIWIANRAGTGSPLTNRRSETIGHGRPASRSRATADIAVPLGACRPHRFDSQTPNRCPTSARNPQKTLIDPKTLRRNADSRRRQ